MGRSMYNFGKQTKEKARQQKQLDKASKRLLAKQQKAGIKTDGPDTDIQGAEAGPVGEIVVSTAEGEIPRS